MPHARAATALLLAGVAAARGQWSDTFNRASGPIGPSWQVLSGAFAVQNNRGSSVGFTNQWMRHAAAAGHYADINMSIDAIATGAPSLQYVALASGLGGTNNLFVKVQGKGAFTHYAFYQGFNVSAWEGAGSGFFPLAAPFTAARMTVSIGGGGDTARLDLDTNFDGIPDQSYTASGLSTISGSFGAGVAVGGYDISTFDNWAVTRACYADCNSDGVLNLADMGCFQTRLATGDPWADCNGDGALNLADFGCFSTKFVLGCP
jgi:hypothetical protein